MRSEKYNICYNIQMIKPIHEELEKELIVSQLGLELFSKLEFDHFRSFYENGMQFTDSIRIEINEIIIEYVMSE